MRYRYREPLSKRNASLPGDDNRPTEPQRRLSHRTSPWDALVHTPAHKPTQARLWHGNMPITPPSALILERPVRAEKRRSSVITELAWRPFPGHDIPTHAPETPTTHLPALRVPQFNDPTPTVDLVRDTNWTTATAGYTFALDDEV